MCQTHLQAAAAERKAQAAEAAAEAAAAAAKSAARIAEWRTMERAVAEQAHAYTQEEVRGSGSEALAAPARVHMSFGETSFG